MTEDPRRLALDAELARARLDLAIDRLEDRLTPAGLADEAIGMVRRADTLAVIERGARALARHPLPVVLIAAGAGLLAWRLADRQRPKRGDRHREIEAAAADDGPGPGRQSDAAPETPRPTQVMQGDRT
jgi:hypothetical protein